MLAFSSANDPGNRDAFLAAGASAYFDKADLDGLLAAVAELASHRRGVAPPDRPTAGGLARDEPLTLFMRAWPALARVHIAARGALRDEAAARLIAAVTEHAQPDSTVILDLSEIAAIDDQGVAALADCGRLAEARGAELELHDPSRVARSHARPERRGLARRRPASTLGQSSSCCGRARRRSRATARRGEPDPCSRHAGMS